ncbi:AP-1-like transcription factor napA [Colletotrichum siamense]|nr:AP-1-like transcription factor napA [Colletotrichum siamense]KAI8157046.1 AP-1-like transcription factor napA [Colletotrichum sp. SAR 10_71]KAI8167069.1 AP-1-like transcription factor napA [Colletotrichum sp. SAR 10_70]KAI8171409.1 AP-1-like transcription factor napA [Colletotrichum sp. SAR 10_65]KAI8176768.1 AP-1-like transcription factor napA [Colletotrichum sp. SAR 10_75]KAI8230439.1 AP-1-like transcription factor napA [Colletotrichum sp. SAR 10_86]KAI8232049.1 AP-1-like transcription f
MNSTSPEIPPYTMVTGFPPMGPNNTAYDLIASQFAARIGTNENGYCTPTSLWSCPPSPTSSIDTNKAGDSHDDCSHSSTSESSLDKASQKSRRANRYKNCSETVLSKRRAQNRANQRAYRKRKEQRLEELQQQIDDMHQKNDALCCAYRLLANECCRLRAGQVTEQSSTNWNNMNGANNLILDMAALNAYRTTNPIATSSPATESYMEYPGTPEQLWSPYP